MVMLIGEGRSIVWSSSSPADSALCDVRRPIPLLAARGARLRKSESADEGTHAGVLFGLGDYKIHGPYYGSEITPMIGSAWQAALTTIWGFFRISRHRLRA
jgi:hypothetical protein